MSDYPHVEAAVENKMLLGQIEAIRQRIVLTLQKNLSNSVIDLSFHLADKGEIKYSLTKPEAFKTLKEEDSAFQMLIDEFELELG